ncbi:MAG: fructosamine kinase family protein [Mogibacterium sp.]|nr:fructosamine kinase family protein [Mogibacterium sp.]
MNGIDDTLKNIYGNDIAVVGKTPVSGGDINRAYALHLSDGGRLFMKANRKENADFFRAEAEGLEALRSAGAISVPGVIARGMDDNESFLLLEYIEEGRRSPAASEELGRRLAQLHMADTENMTISDDMPGTANLVPGGRYGFLHDNYIGAGFQCNEPAETWTEFFTERRLRPQFEKASSYWDVDERKSIERFLDRMDRYLAEPERPSLLHGDLWAGNYMIDSSGEPWLIDPAAYVGHAEADLAMTELFGGFDRRFYDSYRETAGIDPGYADRRDIYNLYHLLNHLNLFGGSYLYSVLSIVKRYV